MTNSFAASDNFDKFRNQDEVKLIERVVSGEKRAIERLFEKYRKVVLKISEKYMDRGVYAEKLMDAGNQGLLKAAKRFHDTVGFNFSAYAAWWIRESILKKLK